MTIILSSFVNMFDSILPSFSGPLFCIGMVLGEFIFQFLIKFFVFIKQRKYKKEIKALQETQKTYDPKEQFSKWALCNRKIKKLQKATPEYTKLLKCYGYITTFVVPIIFCNCWLCNAPQRFFLPMTFMARFPHKMDKNADTLRIGFFNFWNLSRKLNEFILNSIFK